MRARAGEWGPALPPAIRDALAQRAEVERLAERIRASGCAAEGAGGSCGSFWTGQPTRVTHDAGKVGALLHNLHGLRSDGTHRAAKLYAMGSGGELAVDGATLVLSRVRDDVIASLDRDAHGQGLTAAQH